MPRIIGTTGSDVLTGTADADTIDLFGGSGDSVNAGDGDDTIVTSYAAGSSRISAGRGNDRLTLSAETYLDNAYAEMIVTVDMGEGNDLATVDLFGTGLLLVDLGAGDDTLIISEDRYYALQQAILTLGDGRDFVFFGAGVGLGLANRGHQVIITDFAAGAGGDVLNLGEMLLSMFATFFSPPAENPFASGHLRLVQEGADTLIVVDVDGYGPLHGEPRVLSLFRLRDVQASALTAENFNGFDPRGGSNVAVSILGGSAGDLLFGHPGGGQVDGAGGDDRIRGSVDADVLLGGGADDRIEGGAGDDVIRGGEGNDVLDDMRGNDLLDGGGGDDLIDLWRPSSAAPDQQLVLLGGDGNDRIAFTQDMTTIGQSLTRPPGAANLDVDLGAGNDSFYLANWRATATVTLGAGQDRVELGANYIANYGFFPADSMVPVTITDFAVGNGGDVIDLTAMVLAGNPFASGTFRLIQSGNDTLITRSDLITVLLRLSNVDASQLTAHNLGGYSPSGNTIASVTRNGGAGADQLLGGAGADKLNGLGGADVIEGRNGNDLIDGGDGDDRIGGGYGNDQLTGGLGNDVLEDIGRGADTLSGGDGDDRIRVRHLYVSQPPDTVTISAGAGADEVDWSADDVLVADLGTGDDRITLHGNYYGSATLTLGEGRDTVTLAVGQWAGAPVVITDFTVGKLGDRLDWQQLAQSSVTSPWTANPFESGKARLDQVGADTQLVFEGIAVVVFRNVSAASLTFENLGFVARPATASAPTTRVGTAADETLNGTAQDDTIYGRGGHDVLNGGASNDRLFGEDGMDLLIGGAGADTLDGGAGIDRVSGGAGADRITDAFGSDFLKGGDGDDIISVTGNWTAGDAVGSIEGGSGIDIITLDLRGSTDAIYRVLPGTDEDFVNIARMETDAIIGLAGDSRTDTIELGAGFVPRAGVVLTVGFDAGLHNDRILFRPFLDALLAGNSAWGAGKDPFALGFLELRPGLWGSTEIWFNPTRTASASSVLVVQLSASISSLSAINFGGYNPHARYPGPIFFDGDLTIAPGTVTITENGRVVGDDYAVQYVLRGADAEFVNHGTLITRADVPLDLAVFRDSGTGSGLVVNAADGRMIVESSWADETGVLDRFLDTFGVVGGRPAATFRNDGQLEVSARDGIVTGVAYDGLTINNGTILVNGPLDAIGIELSSHSSFINAGALTVHGGEYAVGVNAGRNGYYGQSIVNTGTITVTTDPSSPYGSIGMLLPGVLLPFVLTNAGTITADFAYYTWEPNQHMPGFDDVLTNTGVINGAVLLARGNDRVVNSGTMAGRTMLEDGEDRYEGQAGEHYGSVEGGNGDDALTGGRASDSLFGDSGSDRLIGNGGGDYIDGGSGSDVMDGGAGIDTVSYLSSLLAVQVDLQEGTGRTTLAIDYLRGFEEVIGSRVADRLSGATAAETLVGFDGNDILDGRGGNDVLLGGRGADVLTGGLGSDRFLFDRGDGVDQIVDFTAGDRIEVYGYAKYAKLVQSGADVVITLSATDILKVRNATVSAVSAGLVFDPVPLDFAVPGIEDRAIFADADTAIGAGVALAFGDVQPELPFRRPPSATAAVLGVDVSLWNAGSIAIETTSAEFLTTGITEENVFGFGVERVVIETGGRLLVTAQASDAIGIARIEEVWNRGTISVRSLSGDATGVGDIHAERTIFVNSGLLEVTAAGSATGMVQSTGSTLAYTFDSNSGTIDVHGGKASLGVGLYFAEYWPGFRNAGTIRVTDDTDILDSIGVRVILASHADLFNSGTIEADYSLIVKPGEFGAPRPPSEYGLNVYNSGTMTGDMVLSQWNDIVFNSGTITGVVLLADGDDLYDGRLGILNGSVDGLDGNDRLLAGAGSQKLSGGSGGDLLSGGAGEDRLIGGTGRDAFRFETGFGRDTIMDFQAGSNHDYIDIAGYSAYQSMVQSGADVVITFSASDVLVLRNTSLASITSAMLRFGAAPIAATVVPTEFTPATPPNRHAPTPPTQSLPPLDGTAGADLLTGMPIADTLRGLGGNDVLVGIGGNDVLDGGTGSDRMEGGLGDDLYIVDSKSDVVIESGGGGIDTVRAAIDYTLGNDVERLILAGSAIKGIGNAMDNIVTGNAGANFLYGGAGADTLMGGLGDDSYFVESAGDLVIEAAGEGTDTVNASISFALGTNVERLMLTGAAAINGTGNALDNAITGNGAANLLDGGTGADVLKGDAGNDSLRGGLGADVLTGGAGLDSYRFDTALGNGNVDRITDFNLVEDVIRLDRAIFSGLSHSGALDVGALRLGAAAADADDRILYDPATGNLWYDADGIGAGGAVLFASMAVGLALTQANFMVVG